jgi:hypothetical protein
VALRRSNGQFAEIKSKQTGSKVQNIITRFKHE